MTSSQGGIPSTVELLGVNEEDDSSSDSEYDSSSDDSFQPFSLLSSDTEYSSLSSEDLDSDTESDADGDQCPENLSDYDTMLPSSTPASHVQKMVNTHKFVGDNVDTLPKQRRMRTDKRAPDGIHYFHSYAVRDRIDFSHLSEKFPDPASLPCADDVTSSLLPSSKDDKAIRKHFSILLSRELVSNVPFFKSTFDGAVQWHITHQFYDEMSTKSEVVSSQYTCSCHALSTTVHVTMKIHRCRNHTSGMCPPQNFAHAIKPSLTTIQAFLHVQ